MDKARVGSKVWTIAPSGLDVIEAEVVKWPRAKAQRVAAVYEKQHLGLRMVDTGDCWPTLEVALDSLANRLERAAASLREELEDSKTKGC